MEEFLGIPLAEQEQKISTCKVNTLKNILLHYFKDKVGEAKSKNKKEVLVESLKRNIAKEKNIIRKKVPKNI